MGVYGEILNEEAYLCEVAGLSKKDLLDNPDKVESKVRKLLDQKFSSAAQAVAVFIAILSIVAGSLLMIPTIGLSFVLSIFFTAMVCEWISVLDTKSKKKSLIKIKAACFKIKAKHEKHLVKNPDDTKCKEALKKITDMIAHIEKIEKDVEHEKEMKELAMYKSTYFDALDIYINFDKEENNPDVVFLLFKMFSESDIVSRFEKCKNFDNFSELMSDYDYLVSDNFSKEKQKPWMKDYFLVFYMDDDYAYAYVKGTKKFVRIDYDGLTFFHPSFSCDQSDFEWYKRVDREEGYFLLSEPPKGIERKPVIEKK